ncbi:MAG: VCBS repeat-containing protein [Polyangiales bacterium]
MTPITSEDFFLASGAPHLALPPGTVFWRARSLLSSGASVRTSAVWQFVVPSRDAAIQTASGYSLDFNGDGHRDLAIWNSAGHVEIHLGGTAGPSNTISGTLRTTRGTGASVRLAGDVNGDGFSDLVVSVNATSTLFLGSTDVRADIVGLPISVRDATRTTDAIGVGDVNCDGFDDLGVLHDRASGAPEMTESSIVFGASSLPSSWVVARSFGAASFLAIQGAAALNDDACSDVLVVRTSGVQFYLGARTGFGGLPLSTVNLFSSLGVGASFVGDVDGNGRTDVATTFISVLDMTPISDLYLTPELPPFSRASQHLSALAPNITPIGDVDNDGFADCVALTADELRVHRGTAAGYATTPFATLPRRAGETVPISSGADFNRDGFDDLVVTSPASLTIYRGAATPPLTPLTTIAIPSSTVAF